MERDEQTDYRSGCSSSKNDEWNGTSSKHPIEDCTPGESSIKKGRLNGVECQNKEDEIHRNSSRQNNEGSVSVSHETKRQHFWDAMSYNSNQRSFLLDNERDVGQSSNTPSSQHRGFHSDRDDRGNSHADIPRHSGLGFLQAGTVMEGCSTSSGSGPSSWRLESSSRDGDNKRIVAASCTGDGEGLSSNSRDQSVDMRGKRFILEDGHREMRQIVEDHAGHTDNIIANLNMPCDGIDYMNSSRRSLHIHENEFPEERRATRRRRISTTGLLETASSQSSRTSSLWGENFLDGPRRTGLLRSDEGPCSSINFNTTVNDPMMRIWDDFPDNNAVRSNSGFTSNNSDASRPVISSSDLFRNIQDEPLNLSSEPSSSSQVHSLFASSSSQPIALPQPQSLDLAYVEQQHEAEPRLNRTSANVNLDHLCNERANSSSNLVISRGNLSIPRFVVRDRIDGSRMSGVSSRSSRGVRRALLDSSLGSHNSSQVTGSSANRTDARGHGHRLVNPLPDSGGAAHVLALMPNAQSNGVATRSMLPPGPPGTTSNRAALVTSSRVPRRSQSGQHPSSARAALFVDGVDGLPRSRIQNILGLPFNGSHLLSSNGDQRRRLLSEILSTLEQASRGDELNYEELMMLDPSVIYRGIDANDQHRDMRLDVDNMSYEELLALEERIGDVSTGLTEEMISACVSESKYSSLDATVAALSQDSDVKCSVCQEEFVEDDEVGRLDCGHGYHTVCIKQWLLLKNLCPICKASAYTKS